MARKKSFKDEEVHENHERWLVSYADFITLLFAFFVVMYAVSSINEGKYKVLSGSLVNAFKNTATDTNPVQQTHLSPIIKERQQNEMIKVVEEKEDTTYSETRKNAIYGKKNFASIGTARQ